MRSMLSGEAPDPGPHVAHYRLQLRVRILPEIDEPPVVLKRLRATAALLVRLAQSLVGGCEYERRLKEPIQVGTVGGLLVGGERRIGLVRPLKGLRQLVQIAQLAAGPVAEGVKLGDRILRPALR